MVDELVLWGCGVHTGTIARLLGMWVRSVIAALLASEYWTIHIIALLGKKLKNNLKWLKQSGCKTYQPVA